MSAETLRVILVDDNPVDRLLALRELSSEFPQVQAEQITDQATFEQALAKGNFDVVVTDYQLHWGNGLQVLREIKDRFPETPVIMFTNSGNGELAARAMKQGLDDYVTKSPQHYVRLAAAVRSALEYTLANRRVERLQRQLQQLLERLEVGVFRANEDGRLLEANAAFFRLAGDPPPVAQLCKPPADPLIERWEQEVEVSRPGEPSAWLKLSAVRSAGVIDGVLTDISATKRLEEERHQASALLEERVRERTAQLEAANRDLEEFSFSVSHDLREPLRNMQGLAQALLEDFGADLAPAARQYAQLIVSSGRQMDSLIQDLLAYSRLGRTSLPIGPVDLGAVVTAVLEQLAVRIGNAQATVRVITPLPQVMGQYQTLVQVVLNLVSNAITFVAPGTPPEVCIRTEQRPDEPWVRLWVEDNGIGIPAENHQRIFRVFERLHGPETYPGTGVGLAIVRRGIERLGGRVGLESQPGAGSRFWVELPTP
jgi:signal transduction histidine kinase